MALHKTVDRSVTTQSFHSFRMNRNKRSGGSKWIANVSIDLCEMACSFRVVACCRFALVPRQHRARNPIIFLCYSALNAKSLITSIWIYSNSFDIGSQSPKAEIRNSHETRENIAPNKCSHTIQRALSRINSLTRNAFPTSRFPTSRAELKWNYSVEYSLWVLPRRTVKFRWRRLLQPLPGTASIEFHLSEKC